jgi:hypothetical protein
MNYENLEIILKQLNKLGIIVRMTQVDYDNEIVNIDGFITFCRTVD